MKNFEKIGVLFCVFFKVSLVTLGGGLAMMPIIQREFTEKREWMTDDEMMDILAVAQSLPGIIALNMGATVGYRIAGFAGALASILGSVLPPFFAIAILVGIVARLRQWEPISGLFLGIRAAACAVILAVAIKLFKKNCRHCIEITVSAVSFCLIGLLRINAAWVILAALALSPLLRLMRKQ